MIIEIDLKISKIILPDNNVQARLDNRMHFLEHISDHLRRNHPYSSNPLRQNHYSVWVVEFTHVA